MRVYVVAWDNRDADEIASTPEVFGSAVEAVERFNALVREWGLTARPPMDAPATTLPAFGWCWHYADDSVDEYSAENVAAQVRVYDVQ